MTEPTKYVQRIAELLASVACTYKVGKCPGIDHAVATVNNALTAAAHDGFTVMVIGNGGSAAAAAHFAEDLIKLRGTRAMSFDSAPLLTCLGNDLGFDHVYEFPVKLFANGGLLFAISASGQSDDVLRAARAASRRHCTVVTLTGFAESNPLRKGGHVNFHVPSSEYGEVEVAHAALLHCILDCK